MEKIDQMTKAQQKIAQYIIKHPDSAPFLTASKLAQFSGVGEATVVRFAVFLGYQGYPDMQRHMQEALKKQWTNLERLRKSSVAIGQKEKSVLHEVLHDDLVNLQATLQQANQESFDQAVNALIEAEKIYILAFRSATCLGAFLEFYLNLILQNTKLIRHADGIPELLLDMTERDVMIGMGFSRYTRRTVEGLKFAREKGAKTICLTDHLLSPLMPYADIRLTAASDTNSIINSFVAPLSIINALITAITRIKKDKVEKRLEELEELWDNFHVFHQSFGDSTH
jgi:DNA-binding MurR/RpiR family transcriptional regulator